MRRYFFEIAYKGTRYHGWQRQENALAIQQIVEDCLCKMLGREIRIVASGRTDTGVHCQQQFFHLDLADKETKDLRQKLNSFLPYDISILNIFPVKPEAHARFDATQRGYQYRIHQVKDPFRHEVSLFFDKKLDLQTMNEAAVLLLGKHDFQCFSKIHTDVDNFYCAVNAAQWEQDGTNLVFNISANRFLRGMVRAIVGTMLDISKGKTSVDQFRQIIEGKDRKAAGAAAPAKGLFLMQVSYPDHIFLQ